VFCLLGCGITSWRLGRHEGITDTVKHFIDIGLLKIVDDEDEDY
jgi:hypothetical protein